MRTALRIGGAATASALLATLVAAPGGAQVKLVRVPRVTGRGDMFSAYDVLRSAGFRVAVANGFSATSLQDPGVLTQRPRRGSVVPEGSVVTITAGVGAVGSSGVPKPMPTAVVPSFAGKPPAKVIAWAEHRRLYWAIRQIPPLPPSSAPHLLDNFRVTRQQPAPGSRLRLGVITHGSTGRGFRPTPVTVWVAR